MRYPRILTCWSARPTYCSCPSSPQRTRSPVRYIRVPGAPNGQGTKRVAVKPVRRTYPILTPSPATYSSPMTPGATGRSQASSTNNAVPGTGDPIGTDPDVGVSGALIAAYTVVSVGPYALIIVREDAQRSTSSGGHASPPTSSAAGPSPSGVSIPAAEGVWVSTVTRSATSSAWKSSGAAATDSGTTTSRPPASRAPQISHTEKSKA